MKRILIISALAALLPAMTGCQAERIKEPEAGTQIILAPSVYGAFQTPETRAIDLRETVPGGAHQAYNGFNGVPIPTQLPLGSTVWLTYRKGTPTSEHASEVDGMSDEQLASVDPDWFTWEASSIQAYIVQNSAGYNALYPIPSEIQQEGGVDYLVVTDTEHYSNPLYLKPGYYQFRMVSPANKIVVSNLKMQVNNGMYVYANDERYTQTRSKVIKVKNNNAGVQNITLNPMINQTARIKVTLNPGPNVSRMEMLSQGVEISGLQNPEREPDGKLMFQWSSLDIRDTLQMKKADKYSRAYITDFSVNSDGSITGDVGILPTDAMSTMTVILVNMAVNGIPTQYLLPLYSLIFHHGHSYNLNLEIGLDGDIRVMSWANQAWTGDVDFN